MAPSLSIPSVLSTPTGKLIAVAVVSTSLTSLSILSFQALRRTKLRRSVKAEAEALAATDEGDDLSTLLSTNSNSNPNSTNRSNRPTNRPTTTGNKRKVSEHLIRESLARNYVYFGEEGMEKIRGSFVVIVGLGGVGSAAATMLVRSGVGRVRLIDFDQVSLSSLNRHSTATLANVGEAKVIACADYFAGIAPWVEVEPVVALFGKDVAPELLAGNPDFVLDCIDNIDSKIELLVYCHQNKLPVFSALGAAAKSDPSRIQVSDISTTFEDPLARSVRRRLKLEGVLSGIPVVYSTEKPRAEIGLLPLDEAEFQKGKVDELSPIANFRVRILPVLGPLPAMFGNAAATFVLNRLGGFEMETLPVKDRMKMATSMYKTLATTEMHLTGSAILPISEQDVLYIFEEIHRARSVAPPYFVPSRPMILRWKKERGLAWDNLVIFSREEGLRHERECLIGSNDPEEYWGAEVTELVDRRMAEERRLRHYRM